MELCEIDICFFCLLILNSTINKTLETFYFWEKYAERDFAKLTIVILWQKWLVLEKSFKIIFLLFKNSQTRKT